jgi:hypothetical protein
MKQALLEELNRINELLGTKQKINEQLSAFLKGLVPALRNDFLDAARTVFSGKLINKIDDLTEVEIAQVLKSSAAKMVRRNIFAEITNDLMMTSAKFSRKTSLELMQDLRALGVKDPDFAAAYLKRFAKDNAVDTADNKFASVLASTTPPAKPIDFGSNTPLQGTYSAADYIRAAELDPILGPILKKSGKSADLEEWLTMNMSKGVISQSELTSMTRDFIRKIPPPSGNLGRKWTQFTSWALSLKGGASTLGVILLAGILFEWWTAETVLDETKERIFNDEKTKPTSDSTQTKPPVPVKGSLDDL